MSGSYKSLLIKYQQLQTFVKDNFISLTGDNTWTGTNKFDTLTNQNLQVLGEATFTYTPHCVQEPLLAQDLANKGYVDSIIGQSGNGFILYLNKSQVIIGGYALSNTVTTGASQNIVVQVGTTAVPIATFITNVGFPAILTLPSGLWQLSLWSYMSNTSGIVNIYFQVNVYTSAGVIVTTLATSGLSSDVNGTSTNPDLYHISATVPETNLTTDQRIGIRLFAIADNNANRNLTCLFEDGHYSFINTSIGLGTALLSQNNTWIGNNYVNTALVGNSSKLVANTEFVTMALANSKALFLTTSNNWSGDNTFINQPVTDNSTKASTTFYADRSATNASTALITGNTTFTGINSFPTALAGTNTLQGATCQFVTTAVANSTANILSANNTWTGVNTFSGAIPVADNTGRVATTAFVNTFSTSSINGILSGNNTFTGSNIVPYPLLTDSSYQACPTLWVNDRCTAFLSQTLTFTSTVSGTTQASSDTTTKVATCAFVHNVCDPAISALLTSNNSWTGTNTATSQVASDNSTKVATTFFVKREIGTQKTAILGTANNWTGTNTFPTQLANDNSTKASTTAYAQTQLTTIKNTFLASNVSWTGICKCPTASTSTTGTQVASVQFCRDIGNLLLTNIFNTFNNTFTGINTFPLQPSTNTGFSASTCFFVNRAKDNVLGGANTFSGIQSFTSVIPANDNSTRACTTAFLNTFASTYYSTNFLSSNWTFTGLNTCPTPATSVNTQQIANCAFVYNKIVDYVANTLPTLALNWSGMTVSTQLSTDNSTKVANTQFVQTALSNGYNGMLSVTNIWTGSQRFNTAVLGTANNLVATTAFVQNALTNFLGTVNIFTSAQTFNGNIIAGYNPQASGSGSASQLGYTNGTSSLPATSAVTNNTIKNHVTLTIGIGVWLITLNIQLSISVANANVTAIKFGLYTTSTGVTQLTVMSDSIQQTLSTTLTSGQTYTYNHSFVLVNTVSTTSYFNSQITFSTGTIVSTYTYSYTRIA